MCEVPSWFIAVHCGAGYHQTSKEKAYLKLIDECCNLAGNLLTKGASSTTVTCEVIKLLENNLLTNAGTGSNLNLEGNVQCDAALMNGDGNFAAVGAMETVKNPIFAAHALLTQQKSLTYSRSGLIPPMILVGPSADIWASKNKIECVHNNELITRASLTSFNKARLKLDKLLTPVSRADERDNDLPYNVKKRKWEETHVQDTVGAICVDSHGNISSGVSSGGSILKQPGRVGHSAMYGAGCWADESTSKIAVSTTGCGEHIVRTFLAKEYANALISSSLDCVTQNVDNFMKNKFINHPSIVLQPNKICGVLSLISNSSDINEKGYVNVIATQTSQSFGFGFASSSSSAKTVMSRMTKDEIPGQHVLTNEYCISL